MSYYDYKMSQKIEVKDYPFYAIIMGAMRKADDINLEKLMTAFPETYKDLKARYNAPGGFLPGDSERR